METKKKGLLEKIKNIKLKACQEGFRQLPQ